MEKGFSSIRITRNCGCTTRQPLEKLLAFFDAELATRGWSVPTAELGTSRKDETGVTAHYVSAEKPSLELRLKRGDDGRLAVEIDRESEKSVD